MTNKILIADGRKLKHWALWVIVALVAIFAFQNQLAVSVRFLFWNLEISRFALIVLTFAIGGVCGFLARNLFAGKAHHAGEPVRRD